MLEELEKYAKDNNVPIMMKDGIEYLCNYIKENNIKTILEIGSAIGYSSIKMAQVSEDISITTIERDKERYEIAVSNIHKFNLDNRINIIYGDAIDVEITGKYDLIFIDASKGRNIVFFNKFKDNLNNNGVIITDNLSFHGLVEDESLIKTKNQRGIVRHIKKYIDFLDNNKEFHTNYIPLGDKISISKRNMSKLVVCPSSIDYLDKLLNMNIDGIVLGIENLSVFPEFKVSIDKLYDIVNNTDKEVIVSINKMIHNKDIPILEDTLLKLDKINISKIIFYDIGIINIAKRLGIKKELVIYGEHINTSIYSNRFYNNHKVSGSVISNDITLEEILDIKNNTNMCMMMIAYGYIPMFYSRRYLINNYFKYIDKEKTDNTYYMHHDSEYYMIKESNDGTIIYTKKPINLINEIDKLNVLDYLILDGSYNNDNEFMDIVNSYINKEKTNKDEYIGFLHTKTIYKVKSNE